VYTERLNGEVGVFGFHGFGGWQQHPGTAGSRNAGHHAGTPITGSAR
jgi:hypothetical protein